MSNYNNKPVELLNIGELMSQLCKMRSIEPKDNNRVAYIIRTVLAEFGCVGEGWGSSDSDVDHMYETYQSTGSDYFVIEDLQNNVMGGGGFAALQEADPKKKICELRKMYFLPEVRSLGFGKMLLENILVQAHAAGYKEIYLETIPALSSAVGLYKKLGFHHLAKNKGNTGHQSKCNVFMARALVP